MALTYHNVETVEVLDASDLTPAEREDFDYLDWNALELGEDSREFARYRGEVCDLGDVMLAPNSMRVDGWDGFNSDSFWSGIAFRYFDEEGNYTVDTDNTVTMALVIAEED